MARLTFLGAVEGVTGSMYLLEAADARILLDCGLFQGRRSEEAGNWQPLPFAPDGIDAVVLSHAHLDHSGRLPLLVAQGYRGPIWMTRPTNELIEVLLRDAAALQERDVEWENKRRRRAGKKEMEPLYREADVHAVLDLCTGIRYHHRVSIAAGVDLRFADAGHILGSSIVELFITEHGAEKKLVFSGDLGNAQAALLRDPDLVESADVLLLESTYGDRDHRSMEDTLQEFEDVVMEASENGGNILIPSFAVGRTQEIIFRLGELYQQGKLKHQAIYLDSPMAIAVTEIYHRYQNVYNDEDREAILGHSGRDTAHAGTGEGAPAHPSGASTSRVPKPAASSSIKSLHTFLPILRYSTTTAESMALNRIEQGAIIIAGSGMCNGGRIRHHLKHNLWRRQSHVIFVGFQAQGTPGRALIDGAETFRIGGDTIIVRARLHTLGGFSAHASQSQLLEWLGHFKAPRPQLFLVHGEEDAKQALRSAAKKQGWAATIPGLGELVNF